MQRTEVAKGYCAPEKVERVSTNLVTNSLRYTPAGGQVTVSVTGAAGMTFISVEDTGIGIDPQSTKQVLKPSSAADPARPFERGRRAGFGYRPGADPGPGRPHLGRAAGHGRHPDLLRPASRGRPRRRGAAE